MRSSFFKFSIFDIVEIAVMCALAVVLDTFVKIPIGATGGSINVALLPLFIVAFRHGWFKGFIASGIVFALITCLLDGYGFQFFFFEYFLAFGSVAISGLFGPTIFKNFNKKSALGKVLSIAFIVLGVAITFVIRTICGTIDSMIFYEYAFGPAFVYNVSYIGPSCLILAIVLPLLLPVFKSINQVYPTVFLKDVLSEETSETEDSNNTNNE